MLKECGWVPGFVLSVALLIGVTQAGLFVIIPKEFENTGTKFETVWTDATKAIKELPETAQKLSTLRRYGSAGYAQVVQHLSK